MTDQGPDLTGLPADPTTAPFWRAAREHRLVLQRCRSCGRYQFYPRPFCLSCSDPELDWVEASGGATVYSKTTVRIPVIPDIEPPYVVAIVTLDEGYQMLTNIVGVAGEDVEIGMPVEVSWIEFEGDTLPAFAPRQKVAV